LVFYCIFINKFCKKFGRRVHFVCTLCAPMPWGFGVNSFKGGTWNCQKVYGWWSPIFVFYCIFMTKFFKPHPLLPPMVARNLLLKHSLLKVQKGGKEIMAKTLKCKVIFIL
jgi:hypothetical protein